MCDIKYKSNGLNMAYVCVCVCVSHSPYMALKYSLGLSVFFILFFLLLFLFLGALILSLPLAHSFSLSLWFGSFVLLLHAVTMSTRSLLFLRLQIDWKDMERTRVVVVSSLFDIAHLKQFRCWFHLIKQRLCVLPFFRSTVVAPPPCTHTRISFLLWITDYKSVSQ